VTSLVALLPPEAVGAARYNQGLAWIMRQMGTNSTIWYRLRERLLGTGAGEENPGWPWFPGTAAWVTPTAMAILALAKVEKRRPSVEVRSRMEKGRRFLLSHRCADGGWNHGSSRTGYEELLRATGAAMLAWRALPIWIKAWLRPNARGDAGAEGAWLKLGLLAHGRKKKDARHARRALFAIRHCACSPSGGPGHNAFIGNRRNSWLARSIPGRMRRPPAPRQAAVTIVRAALRRSVRHRAPPA
jgi:hypothetical protein